MWKIVLRLVRPFFWPLGIAVLMPAVAQGQSFRSASPRQFVAGPNQEAVLRWKSAKAGDSEAIPCRVSGFDGNVIADLEAKQVGGDVQLKVNLPQGFYTIWFPKQDQAFGLIVVPEPGDAADEFFGLDTALSVMRSLAVRGDLIQVLRRIGVTISRERLLWNEIEPQKDVWDWQSKRAFDQTRELYLQANVGVLELFHDCPAWIQTDKKSVFPEDLPVVAKSWEEIGRRWAKTWQGLEVWNEADIPAGQGGPQAEQYVPLVKTVRYALQQIGCPAPIGGGVFAYLTRPYMDLAAENGLLQTSDFISFHYYSSPMSLESYVAEYRRYLKDYGKESMPLWLTECGAPWLGNGNARPGAEIDRKTALGFSELAIEAKACGIARYFPFVLPAYTEHGNKNFGMLDRQESPVRSLAAYAQAVCALSHATYAGDVELNDNSIRARAFARKDGAVIVVAEGEAPGKSAVTFPFPVTNLQGIDGRKLTPSAAGPQPIPDGLIYATARLDDVKPHLKSQTRTMDLFQMGRAPQPARVAMPPVVLWPSVNSPELTPNIRGYEVPDGCTELPVKVRVANLSAAACSVHLAFGGESGGDEKSGQLSQDATIPSESSKDVSATIKVSSIPFNKEGRGVLRITGQIKDGGKLLPAALFFSTPLGLDQCLAGHPYRFSLPLGDFTRWEKNASGPLEFKKSAEGNWSFSVVYGPGDKWAFPKFNVPQEVNLDRVTGVVVRGRCTNPATVRVMTWPKDRGNQYSTTGYSIFKADGKWHVSYVPLSDFLKPNGNEKPGRQIGKISVGISDRASSENTVEISDLFLVGD